jgi:hypothetical protein
LAKLYAVSMMWTLNARSDLRRTMLNNDIRSAGSSGDRRASTPLVVCVSACI